MKRQLLIILLTAVIALAVSGCTKQARKNRHLARAERDFKAEQYDKAEIGYLSALRFPPPDPVAVSRLGQIYYTEGKYLRAYAFLQQAMKLQPDNLEAQTKYGLTLLALQGVDQARTQAVQVLQKDLGNAEAMLLLAETATQPTFKQVEQILDNLPPQKRTLPAWHIARGALYARQNQLDKAESECRQAVSLDPKSSQAHLVLGNFYLLRKDSKQAESALKTAVELAPLRSNARMQYAELRYKAGEKQEAKTAIEELTRKAPDFVPAWLFLAQVAKAEDRRTDYASLLQKVLARDPLNLQGLLFEGNRLLASGDVTNAVVQFERIIRAYGPAPVAEYRLALAHLAVGQTARARACLDQAVAGNTNFVDAIMLQASLNLRLRNTTAALSSVTRLLQQHPEIPDVYVLLATIYVYQRQPEEAASVYRRMADAFPNSPQPPYLLGDLLRLRNKNPEARQALEKALSVSPGYIPAMEALVDLDLAENRPAIAIDRVKSHLEKNPREALGWLLLSKIHMTKALEYVARTNPSMRPGGRPEIQYADLPEVRAAVKEAETAVLRAIEVNPELPKAYELLAKLYVWSNRSQQALDKLTAWVAKTNDVVALTQIGMIHEQARDYTAARATYEKALKVNPNAVEALNNLAWLYAEHMGLLDEGYQLAERARKLQPDKPYMADTLGWIVYRRGDYSRALGLLEDAAAKMPSEPEVQYHVGMAYYQTGQEEPARLALQRATRGKRTFAGTEEAARCLTLLAIDAKTADAAAVAKLEQRLKETPSDVFVLERLASIEERDGAFEKAAQHYRSVLKINPQDAEATLKLARLYSDHLGDRPKALELAKTAHNLAPDDGQIGHLLGRLAFENGDHKWAASLLQESARKLPNLPQISYDLAWAQYSLGQVTEAAVTMRTACEAGLSPQGADDGKQFLKMVAASRSADEAVKAVGETQAILGKRPDYVPALMASAISDEVRGKYQEAADLYTQVLTRYPLFSPAARNLALLCFSRLNDEAKAYELAVKARESFPDDPYLARMLGVVASRRKDYTRAAQLLQQTVRQLTNDAEAYYHLGTAQFRLNQRAQAKQALQRALDLNAPADLAKEARRVLTELK